MMPDLTLSQTTEAEVNARRLDCKPAPQAQVARV
jgi:hypothetical protein